MRIQQFISGLCGLACLAIAGSAYSQQTITDQYGTEILVDVLPPTVQTQVYETQSVLDTGGGEGPLSVDKLGRILVPPPLRERAGLERDVVVLSYLGQIEIWDRARFEARQVSEAEVLDMDEFVGDLAVPLDDDEDG